MRQIKAGCSGCGQIRVGSILAVVLFATELAQASFSNYNSLPIGEQAAGMGGAYTAMSGDCAASPYYNPATMARLKNSSLSASVNVYKKFHTLFGDNNESVTKAALSMNQGFFQPIPSSSGSIIETGGNVFALSILVPDYDFYNGEVPTKLGGISSLSYLDQSLWIGGSYALSLTEEDSVGVTLYYTARNFSSKVNETYFPTPSDATIYSEEKILENNNAVLVMGYHKIFSRNLKLGVSYRPRSWKIHGKGSFYHSSLQTNPYQFTPINAVGVGSDAPVPQRLSLGVAYELPGFLILSADASVYGSENYRDLDSDIAGQVMEHRHVVNFAAGAELNIFSWLKARVGGFTNLSSMPKPQDSQFTREGDHIDYLGFSSNLTYISKDKVGYTFGGYYIGGRGYSKQRTNQQFEVITKSQQVFTMLVATSFWF